MNAPLILSLLVCVTTAAMVTFASKDLRNVDGAVYAVFAGFVSFLLALLVNAAGIEYWMLEEIVVTAAYSLAMKGWWTRVYVREAK
ncbi:hypothetical protein HUS23_08555 [Ectothiorhodospiraceae bacterium 2226]|nr:hypothetical protein HUS23_08555 [Ectothiorhodospiraceae bacterium 2226]